MRNIQKTTKLGTMKAPISLPATVSASDAAKIEQHLEQARGAYSPATERAIRNDTRIFVEWCIANDRQSLPASPETIAAFIDAMATERKPATVARYVSSIARLHRAAGYESPGTSETVKLALKRMRRAQGVRQRQAAPLTRDIIEKMIAKIGDRLIDRRDRALISVAYDTLCRRSELVALTVADIAFTEDGTGTALIARSKGDQEGEGDTRFLAHDTCNYIKDWLQAAGIEEGPLFLSVRKGGRLGVPLEPGEIARVFKRRAKAIGIDPGDISGHSTRVGAAQDAVSADLGIAEIMVAGGWKTPRMVARYSEKQQSRRGAMAKLAAKQNRL